MVSHVWLFVTLWTVPCQAPLFMEFSRQEYSSGLSFPSPGDITNPGMEPGSSTLQADSLPSEPPGKPKKCKMYHQLIEKYWLISKNTRWVLKRLKTMSKICSWIQLTPSTVEINTYYCEFAKYSKMLQNVSLEKGHFNF